MMLDELYKIELNKILYIKDVDKQKFRFSSILLFREYQSRLFKWKESLGYDGLDFFNKNKKFHNLFCNISATWVNDIIPEEKVISDLTNSGFKNLRFTFREYEGFYLSMFINWELFKNKPEIHSHAYLPHPYVPVFKLISRGGSIFNGELKFEIDNGQTYRRYDNNFRMPSLDEGFLSFLDKNCDDFPNQEKVNALWEKFELICGA